MNAQEQVADDQKQPSPQQETTQPKEQSEPKEPQKQTEQKEQKEKKPRKKASEVFTGFTGGMMLHAGYLFSDDPRKVFSNTGLGDENYIKGLPKKGFCYGIGGMMRIHLLNHIHLGAEGYVSTMPLMGTGSNIRSAWGAAFCDAYTEWGKVRPLIGLSVGGGSMRRLFVPDQVPTVYYQEADKTHYNASYAKTPFFLLDPYIGLEIAIKEHTALLIRIDYLLPFGRTSSGLTKLSEDVSWSHFMTPSGPRLYVGFMFGRFQRKKTS
jgi:hypothetical protein